MEPLQIIEKIEELKKQMQEESEKEEPNTYLIHRIHNKIVNLGMMVSYKDALTAKSWTKIK